MQKASARFTAAGIAAASLLGMATMAATPSSAAAPLPPTHVSAAQFSKTDFADLARKAERSGEPGLADYLRSRAGLPTLHDGGRVHAQGWGSWARKAVLFALRHTKDKLPRVIRPYADKIAKVLEMTEVWEKGAIVWALAKAGIPYDVAVATADWIVFFLG